MAENDSQYTYDPKSRRFRAPNGRYVSATEILNIRDTLIAIRVERTTALVNMLYDGVITPNAFVVAMRQEIKNVTIMEYMLGRGGANALTSADYGRIGNLVKSQYRYLNNFTQQIMDGTVSRERAIDRAGLYMDTTRAAHERAKAVAWNVELPEYPGIHPRCSCHVELTEDGPDRVLAYWVTTSAKPCERCEANEAEWNPLVIERPGQ